MVSNKALLCYRYSLSFFILVFFFLNFICYSFYGARPLEFLISMFIVNAMLACYLIFSIKLKEAPAWGYIGHMTVVSIGMILWGTIAFDDDVDTISALCFYFYISNVIGMLFIIISMLINSRQNSIVGIRRRALSRTIQQSIAGGSITTDTIFTGYQGMRSSFAMPMLNQDASVRTPEEHIFQSAIHPTTGFPMINEGFDIAGNPIGMAMHPSAHAIFQHDINPASGMPMMNDSLDIHGSPYGVGGMNDYNSGMSSGHYDHYVHASSSIDHYNQH